MSALHDWVNHSAEARRLLLLCRRGGTGRLAYREHMDKEDAIIERFRKDQRYWHEKELRERNEQRQESASDTRAEVGTRPSEEGSSQGT